MPAPPVAALAGTLLLAAAIGIGIARPWGLEKR